MRAEEHERPIDADPAAGWTPEALRRASERFEGRWPAEVLRWAAATFAPRLALATGFGPEGIVLMHLASQVAPATTVFYLDTGLLFAETHQLRVELSERLGLTFTRVASQLSLARQQAACGPELWRRNPDLCCRLRKVEPLRCFLASQRAWISGIRRDQTRQRANAAIVEWDRANGLVKINPLAGWTSEQVWRYLDLHELPVNGLHAQGYPSIGCWPCTRPVAPGDDPRAGRWPGLAKTECGLHLAPRHSGQ
jgi:phosphoadenosine phosphosulfate reductase